MKRVCAWCGKDMGSTPPDGESDESVSHGQCDECMSNIRFQLGVDLRTFLDSLRVPVLVVGENAILTANQKALEMIGKDLSEIVGRRGGDVFECAHARLPEGCGRTIHCSGCAIRRSVEKTYATGQPCVRVEASLRKAGKDDEQDVRMLLSTEKAGDKVLLRIDEVGPGRK